jgi:hypothetical protein
LRARFLIIFGGSLLLWLCIGSVSAIAAQACCPQAARTA